MPKHTKLTHWREDVPVATKVMAFGAAPFAARLEGNVDGTPVWSWVFTENRKEGFHDYSVGLKPLEFYRRLIGPYPYEKLANVQSKTIFGGQEKVVRKTLWPTKLPISGLEILSRKMIGIISG
jgi:hypothetical protein